MIDLRRMNSVVVDKESKTIKVGGGATWQHVDEEAGKYGLATVGGQKSLQILKAAYIDGMV